jgi:2-desacetyl-2-hydroxyethyl bacteriochlorophyllide A dehydrogenase
VRVAVLEGPGRFSIADEPAPEPRPDEVLLRVAACGVCASELDMWQGAAGHATYPWYPGHEVSGTVEATGEDVTTLATGDRVAVWVTERGYGELVAVRADRCEKVAKDVALDVALGEPLACAVNVVELADVHLADDVVVIGAGFMGHLVHQLVALRGPNRVIVADARDDALERAKGLGADRIVNVTRESLVDVVAEMTDGRGADVSIEMTGRQEPLSILGDVTRMSGTVVIGGYHQGEPRQIPLAQWNWMAFRIANAHFREPATILHGLRTGVRLQNAGHVSLDGLVTHRFGLEEIDVAFKTAVDKPDGFVKATVTP